MLKVDKHYNSNGKKCHIETGECGNAELSPNSITPTLRLSPKLPRRESRGHKSCRQQQLTASPRRQHQPCNWRHH